MKKTLLGFSFLVLISLLFCLKPTSVSATSNFIVQSAHICYNGTKTLSPYVPANRRCYDANWRFSTSVKNIGDSSNANEPGVVNPDFSYGYHVIDSSDIIQWDHDIILASGASRDFYHTISGVACKSFLISAVGSQLDPPYPSWDYKIIDIDSVGPCPAVAPKATPTTVSCPLGMQQLSFSGSGTPLMNDYNTTQYKGSPQYTVFTSNKTGKITKTEIYGTLDRAVAKGNKVLQCKITTSDGTVTLEESSINNGPFTKGTSWMKADFTTPVNVASNTNYRMYCKVNNVAGGGYIYWLDFWNNRIDKTRKIYLCE